MIFHGLIWFFGIKEKTETFSVQKLFFSEIFAYFKKKSSLNFFVKNRYFKSYKFFDTTSNNLMKLRSSDIK